jgi:hypothetical protein
MSLYYLFQPHKLLINLVKKISQVIYTKLESQSEDVRFLQCDESKLESQSEENITF